MADFAPLSPRLAVEVEPCVGSHLVVGQRIDVPNVSSRR